jgi:hypothetical protein
MALAAGPYTIADMNDQTITAKQTVIGIIARRHWGRRISGAKMTIANRLRKNANRTPRDSSGQSSNQGAFANSPLVLHNVAAITTRSLPRQASEGDE